MKRAILAVLVMAGAAFSPVALSQSGESIAKSKGCVRCHASDAKIGPAFKEVSAQYKGDKGAEARLVAKLKEAKTHPKVQASDAELKSVIQYVLTQ